MNFDILVVCGASIAAMLFMLPVKEMRGSFFAISASALSVIIATVAIKGAIPLFTYINGFENGDMSIYFKVLIKAMGITVLTGITADVASDLGMGSVSGKIELAGRVAVILSAMPMFDSLFGEVAVLL